MLSPHRHTVGQVIYFGVADKLRAVSDQNKKLNKLPGSTFDVFLQPVSR
jgi:hypothetical protein